MKTHKNAAALLGGGGEGFAADQGDEATGAEHTEGNALTGAQDTDELLPVSVANRNHHAAAHRQLRDQ